MGLVLTRDVDESIVIIVGGAVVAELTLLEWRNGKARINTEADRSVGIYRREAWDAKCRGEIPHDTPIGTPVIVTREDGAEVRTTTRSRAWQDRRSGEWFIGLVGLVGAFPVRAVRRAE